MDYKKTNAPSNTITEMWYLFLNLLETDMRWWKLLVNAQIRLLLR